MFVHFHVWEWLSIVLAILLAFVWQCKNALIPYTTYNGTTADGQRYFGGWGFDYKASIYGAGGVLLAFLLDVMWPPAIRETKDGENFTELEGEDDMSF